MNEIVKYKNDLNDFELGRLSPNQANLFTYLVFKLKNKDFVTATYDEVSKKLDLPKDNRYFKKLLVESYTRIMDIKYYNIKVHENGNTSGTIAHIFDLFDWDDDKEEITIKVNEANKYLFTELQKEFTQFHLSDFVEINGSHAKTLYRILKQWRTIGEVPLITVDKVKFLFGLKKNYRIDNIDNRVLKPAIEELQPYFNNLVVHKKYEKRKSRGRPKLEGYSFTFDKEIIEKQLIEPTQESIAEKVDGWGKTNRYCPKCKRPIYKKQMENDNGTYFLYGHTDWKTGECDYITYDFSDLLQEYQLQNDKPLNKKQQENKNKLANMFKGLFK